MKGNGRNLYRFSTDDMKFEVPFFQREYVWDEDDWGALLNSIMIEREDRMPFIGSFIFQPKDNGNSNVRVIDGQQRIITLSILVKALIDFYGSNLPSFFLNSLLQFIYSIKSDNFNFQPIYTLRLEPSNADKKAFELVMKYPFEASAISSDVSKIVRAYNFYINQIEKLSDSEKKRLVNKLLTHTDFFVEISLEPSDDEQQIFDSVNSLGQGLTVADLVKNYLFQKIKACYSDDEQGHAQVLKIYNDTWDSVFSNDKDFWGNDNKKAKKNKNKLVDFLKDYATIKGIYGASKNDGVSGLFAGFKSYINNLKSNELVMFANDIKNYASAYYEMFTKFEKVNDFKMSDYFNSTLLLLTEIKHTTFNPYLLKLYVDKPSDLKDKIYALQKFIIQRLIYAESNKNYNKICEELLKKDDPIKYLAEYSTEADYSKFPVYLNKIKKSDDSIARVILFLIEMIRRDKNQNYHSNALSFPRGKNVLSLEHVMPQEWEDNWDNVPCYNYDINGNLYEVKDSESIKLVRKARIYSIGNMAILVKDLNSILGNESIDIKINGKNGEPGIKDLGNFSVTEDIVNIYEKENKWDERNIISRSMNLFSELNDYYKFNPNYIEEYAGILNNASNEQIISIEEMNEQFFENEKVGKIVNRAIRFLLINGYISKEELEQLKTKEYTSDIFGGMYLPMFITDARNIYDAHGRSRYYGEPVVLDDKLYFICSQWLEKNKPYIVWWIKSKLGMKAEKPISVIQNKQIKEDADNESEQLSAEEKNKIYDNLKVCIENKFNLNLAFENKKTLANDNVRFILSYSKLYLQGNRHKYWFAYHPEKVVNDGKKEYYVFYCKDDSIGFSLPITFIEDNISALNKSSKGEKVYYHIVIFVDEDKCTILFSRPEIKEVIISDYKL